MLPGKENAPFCPLCRAFADMALSLSRVSHRIQVLVIIRRFSPAFFAQLDMVLVQSHLGIEDREREEKRSEGSPHILYASRAA